MNNLSLANRMAWTLLFATGLTTVSIAIIVLSVENILGPSSEAGHRLFIESVLLWLLLLGAITLLWYVMSLTLLRPLTSLVVFSQQVRQGQTQTRLQIKGTNEIALVAASINAMLDQIVGQRDALRTQVTQLIDEVGGVGKGDLRVQAVVTQDELGMLATSFNYMVNELSALIVRVKQVTSEIQSAAASTQYQTAESRALAEKQLQRIRTASATVQHMADASRRVAMSAGQLGSETQNARNLTVTGRERIAEISSGMQRLSEDVEHTAQSVQRLARRSVEMQDVVTLLTTLASHTNRLALDAAIQANMAGEHGKGFEAVAQAMRGMAEKTKEEIHKIQTMVRGVQEDIQAAATSMGETEHEAVKGVRYVSDTETIFIDIFTLAERQAGGIDVIIEQARQQMHAAETIEALMAESSEATQEIAHLIRAMATQIAGVAGKTSELDQSVGIFHLREPTTSGLLNALW